MDANGDVIYVPAVSGGGTGGNANVCPGIPTNFVTKWTGTDICNSQVFDDGFFVGIGTVVNANTLFRVENNNAGFPSRTRAGWFVTSLPGSGSILNGLNVGAEGSTNENIGITVAANNTGGFTAIRNWGIQASAKNANENYAGLFVADHPNSGAPNSVSYALYAQCTGFNDFNYGIFAKATQANVRAWAGRFDGDVNVNGGYFQNGVAFTSDAVFKTNLDSINNAAVIISQLKPRSFYFDTTNSYGMNFPSAKQYGLISQDVQSVLPELVSETIKPAEYDSIGNVTTQAITYKTLNYNAFIALLIKNNQELEKRVASLENIVTSCCASGAKSQNPIHSIDVELSDPEAIVLNQNVPNPFAEQTTITYNIPKDVAAAQILFYDINGRQIKAVDITKKGKGQLNVFANDLSNGIYSYTLVVDGKIIETKKMIKQQ